MKLQVHQNCPWIWLKIITTLLPPASEGWGKVIVSLCVSVHTSTGGTPFQVYVGYPLPRSRWGYPLSKSRQGVPLPRSRQGEPPSQVLSGGSPFPGPGRGVPHSQVQVPCPGQIPGWGQGCCRVTPSIQVRSQDGEYPLPEQHSMYLLCGGRFASCAGGLTCL